MKRTCLVAVWLAVLAAFAPAARGAPAAREKLQPFQDLIGSWKGTGVPSGTREERDRGFWQEMIAWQWQFKGKDVWLRADVDKGKHFTRLELRYLPAKDAYELKATTLAKETQTFVGKLADKRLTVERADEKTKGTQRLVFSLLHANRYLYRAEVKAEGRTTFAPVYQVGATKQGVAFASEDKGIECIVSGGKGTMPVVYKGKTYYVCCTGCRDAFNEEPEKYIKEYEELKKEREKEKEKKE
jgi:YHS domain-containing protein